MEDDKPAAQYVTVEIYGQAYHLSGTDLDQVKRLAARVDEQMCAVSAHGRTVDSLRVAVLAALNLADELARAEEKLAQFKSGGERSAEDNDSRQLQERAHRLSELLDAVLEETKKAGS
uniref:Cell division protein ZapA n=1 Tax=mine drainage metagenome TaxID=410659 RepID=E6PYB0_9ZZZZ